MYSNWPTYGRYAQFGWVQRATALAMARGVRRPLHGGPLADVRMDAVGSGARQRPALLMEALLSRR